MSEPRDEIAEVLAVELHVDCPFGNEHIARLVNRKTGRKLASCPECYDISLIVADTKALAERDRRVAGAALREAADEIGEGDGISRFIGMDDLPAAVRAEKRAQIWLRDRADRIEATR